MSKRYGHYALFVFAVLLSVAAHSQTLNDRQIYERCSARLTRTSPDDATDPFIAQINAGTLSGPAACQQLFRLASLGNDGQLPVFKGAGADSKRLLSQRVLTTLNDVHASWMTEKIFNSGSICRATTTNALVDPMEPALFFTRALFGNNVPYSYVVTSTDNLRAIRAINAPTQTVWDNRLVLTDLTGKWSWAGNGQLLGVSSGYRPTMNKMNAFVVAPGDTRRPAAVNADILKNQGGGIIGSQAYILNNFGEGTDWVPDLEKMPRNWSKWIFKDLLCRDLPVLDADLDTKKHTVCADSKKCGIQPTAAKKNSVLSFRQSQSCVQCHATMDQLVGVARNLRSFNSGKCAYGPEVHMSTSNWLPIAPTKQLNKEWDYVASNEYRQEQPYGRLVFRDIYGNLVDKEVRSFSDIGAEFAKRDDMYICAAKRYYQYFTGIDVELLPMTADQVAKLPPDQKLYRNRVITLGKSLRDPNKYNQDAQKLIEAIFELPEYKARDFRLVQSAQGK